MGRGESGRAEEDVDVVMDVARVYGPAVVAVVAALTGLEKVTGWGARLARLVVGQVRSRRTMPAVYVAQVAPITGDWTTAGGIAHRGAYWRVQARWMLGRPVPCDLRAVVPPRCPNCGTELKETERRVLRGYTWACVGCGFSRHSKLSFFETALDVERLARRQIERETGMDFGSLGA